jgi:uncharacterized protein Yka (UPF0111/DUF47 family)
MTAAVTAQVSAILEAAERAADELQQEVEAELVRQATEMRRAAERDAAAIREQARAAADAMTRERVQRLAQLSDDLLARAEAVLGQLEQAGTARRALEELVTALGAAAQAAARSVDDAAAPGGGD